MGDRTKIESAMRELPMGKDLKVVEFNNAFRLVPAKEREETVK